MIDFYCYYRLVIFIISGILLLILFTYVSIVGSRFGMDLSTKYPGNSLTKLEIFFYSVGSVGAIFLNIIFWIEIALFIS